MGNRIIGMPPGDKKTIHKCNKHPTVEAGETCIRCGNALCGDCRLKDKKQAFCSSSCYRLQRLKEFKISSLKLRSRLRRLQEHSPASDAFATMLVLMLTAAIHFAPAQEAEKSPTVKIKQAGPVLKTEPLNVPEPKHIAAAAKKPIIPETKKPEQEKSRPGPETQHTRRTIKARSISRVNLAEKKISITFDGGSNDSSAREILDVLKSRGINTTFFLTASFMRSYPDILKRMVAEGHEIGNHTFSHPHLTTYSINRIHMTLPGIDFDFIKRELDSASKIFTKATGKQMAPYWRAPYGEINRDILRWAAKAGYRHISWTVDRRTKESMDSLDWVADKNSSLYLSSNEIKDRLLAFADSNERARGGIVLMHLGTERKVDIVHDKLEDIIDSFIARGYEVVSISTLLKAVKKS